MVKDRVKAFCKAQNISVAAFEKSIDVANGYVNNISKSIGVDKICDILEKYSMLNIEWLLTGKGNMYKETNATSNDPAIDIYKDMIKAKDDLIQQQKEMIEQLKGMIDQQNDMIDRLHHDILNGGQSACDATDETVALAG